MDPKELRLNLPNIPRAALVGAGIFVILAGTLVGAVAARAAKFQNKILPGVTILEIPIGGLTPEEARAAVQKRADEILGRGIIFSADGQMTTLSPTTISPNDPDLSVELVKYDIAGMVERGLVFGRRKNSLESWLEMTATFVSRKIPVTPQYQVNKEALLLFLKNEFGDLETPVKEAGLSATAGEEGLRYTATDPRPGRTLFYEAAVNALTEQIKRGSLAPIAIALTPVEPNITRSEAAALIPEAERFVRTAATTTVAVGRNEWTVKNEELSLWVTVEESDGRARLAFDRTKIDAFLDPIAKEVEVLPRDAKFKIQNGKVVEFQGSRQGLRIDREATRRALEETWIMRGGGKVELVTEKTEPNVATGDVNDLGIKEILGVGRSNFSGSPRNRVKNIRNGMTKLNGILIKPGEEFSLLNALKPFTVEGGYLPELVIKGDKIIPELGGGLCQIGTTTFRMAMNAGMSIAERQNHSLVVRYYNDKNGNPGTDATIYEPSPDFKFVNDTGAHLLITTEMNETTGDLAFTLWGTSDGRVGSYSKPVVLRWIKAPDPKETPTTDLPPGERKCDVPHPGADASFTYTVELPDGSKKETVYTSHYRALAQVCLVGVPPDQIPPTPDSNPVAVDTGVTANANVPAQ